jgi:ABC-2 type transport system permease protein
MKKLGQIFSYEYIQRISNPNFWFGLLSVPAVIAIFSLVIFLQERSIHNPLPVGYVDRSGILSSPGETSPPAPSGTSLEILPYPDEAKANADSRAGRIQAYFVLGADYSQTSQVRVVSIEAANSAAVEQFRDFVRAKLLARQPDPVAERLIQGDKLIIRAADGSREMGADEWINVLMPFIAGFIFMIAFFSSSGYLIQAVVDEKEDRTMEVLVTSVSPMQLMNGKTLAMIAVGLTELLLWAAMLLAFVLLGRDRIPVLDTIRLAPGSLAVMLLAFLPAFVAISALMVAIGATVADAREGQQVSGLVSLVVVIPYLFALQIMTHPNSPLAILLSFFPLTAPIALTMRVAMFTLPAWQIALNLLALVVFALAALWLAGRAFRLGMLLFGQRLSLKQLFGYKPKKEAQG